MRIFNSRYWLRFFWICVLTGALLSGGRLWEAWQWNWIGLRWIKGQEASIPVVPRDCSHIWLVGMMAGKGGDLPAQRQAFKQAMGCSSGYLSLLQAVMPGDLEMAQLAVQQYPENSTAWFWLGEASAATDPAGARQAYLCTVGLNPRNSLAWGSLGQIYEGNGEFDLAAEAYLKCCLIVDLKGYCCVGAGRIMEQQGNLLKAIEYYRLSNGVDILNHANELEKQLNP